MSDKLASAPLSGIPAPDPAPADPSTHDTATTKRPQTEAILTPDDVLATGSKSSNGVAGAQSTPTTVSTPAGAPLVTLDVLKRDPEVLAFIKRADAQLGVLGFTEHGQRHTSLVGNIAQNVLRRLGYPERTCELAAVAGFLHDIGNCVSRRDHATAGALMAKDILLARGMSVEEVAIVMGAIGNHEESTGDPVGEVSAAINIADKSDVHRSRVRETDPMKFDQHDRVNYASQHSFVRVDGEQKRVELEMSIDTNIAPLMDYFEIFLSRMLFIRRAVQFLECEFRLTINRNRIL